MKTDKFLIAPIKSGQQRNVKPWLIMDDAFQTMRNIYTWRGTVRKRFGTSLMNESQIAPFDQLFTRLRWNIGTTDGAGDFNYTFPAGTNFAVGQNFSIGAEIFTITALGNHVMRTTGASTTHTMNTATRVVNIIGAAIDTLVYFYPMFPVMGFGGYAVADQESEIIFAFDTNYAYNFIYATGWDRVESNNGLHDVWTGADDDFFWTTNYRGALASDFLLFITNNEIADGFRFWDGTNFNQLGTLATTPTTATDFIITALIIVPFKNRLLLMNTTEHIEGTGDLNFNNRVRFSWQGDPTDPAAWLDGQGVAGFLETSSRQAIISCAFIKDRLIVFCESSTWELVFTGNNVTPFEFQKLNDELGVESTQSIIPFDRFALGFGSTGIHMCNGLNVQRVDEAIPNTIFEVSNDESGPVRVAGVRDYFTEVAYWAYNSLDAQTGANMIYPNRVLVYDYVNRTWAYNDDSFTAFGLFNTQINTEWNDLNYEWQQATITWADGSSQDKFRSVITGNQQGFTSIVNKDITTNSYCLIFTNITIVNNIVTFTCLRHNLADNSFIYIDEIQATGGNLGNAAGVINDRIWQVSTVDVNTFTIDVGMLLVTGVYTGGGVCSRVSEIELDSKQYNFYNSVGATIGLNKISFLVDRTTAGQITVTDYTSSSDQSNVPFGVEYVLETTPYTTVLLEATQDRFWHNIYFNSYGEAVQISISYSIDQITNKNVAFSDFQLNAMIFNTTQCNNF